MTFEAWREIMSISLDGSFHCIKACLLDDREQGAVPPPLGGDGAPGLIGKVHGSAAKNGSRGLTRACAGDGQCRSA